MSPQGRLRTEAGPGLGPALPWGDPALCAAPVSWLWSSLPCPGVLQAGIPHTQLWPTASHGKSHADMSTVFKQRLRDRSGHSHWCWEEWHCLYWDQLWQSCCRSERASWAGCFMCIYSPALELWMAAFGLRIFFFNQKHDWVIRLWLLNIGCGKWKSHNASQRKGAAHTHPHAWLCRGKHCWSLVGRPWVLFCAYVF